MVEEQNYSTRDLTLAATLVSLGFALQQIDYQIEGDKPNPIGYFLFENSDELQETLRQFWSGQVTVEPKEFINNMKGLKSQIHSYQKNPHTGVE